MSLTKVSYSMITGTPVNVLDFGADPTGVADSTLKIQAAIDSITDDNVLVVPSGTYKITSTLTLGDTNKGARIVGVGLPTFNFVGLGAAADGIQILGADYRQTQIENLIIDLNDVGRDGIRLQAGNHPFIKNVAIRNTGRHGFAIICSGLNWVENGIFNIRCDNIGASAFYLELSGVLGSFINECLFEMCECRGVSLLSNDSAAVYAVSGGTTSGSKISDVRWANCNFDAERQKSIDNGFDTNPNPMFLKYTGGATNSYESWHIDTGGWETTTGGPDFRRVGLVYAEDGTVARGFNISNLTPGGWSQGGYFNLVDYVAHDVQLGTFRAEYPNGWHQASLNASTTYNFDVRIPSVPTPNSAASRLVVSAAYRLHFFHTTFAATDQEAYTQDFYLTYFLAGADVYGVLYGAVTNTLVGADQFTINSVTVLNSSGGATLNVTTPPALVRINLTTTANWGSGGGDKIANGILTYMGASHGAYSS